MEEEKSTFVLKFLVSLIDRGYANEVAPWPPFELLPRTAKEQERTDICLGGDVIVSPEGGAQVLE